MPEGLFHLGVVTFGFFSWAEVAVVVPQEALIQPPQNAAEEGPMSAGMLMDHRGCEDSLLIPAEHEPSEFRALVAFVD